MNAVAYCHPFVPPEWIAAHGLRPCWLPCRAGDEPAVCGPSRRVSGGRRAAGRFQRGVAGRKRVVLTTTCDQIRYAAALLQHLGRLPVFLLHVPRTWQTAAVRAFYGEELGRLGRFLVGCGGTAPKATSSARRYSATIGRGHRSACGARRCRPVPMPGRSPPSAATLAGAGERGRQRDTGIPPSPRLPLSASPRPARPPAPRCPFPAFPWHSSAGRCPEAITNC